MSFPTQRQWKTWPPASPPPNRRGQSGGRCRSRRPHLGIGQGRSYPGNWPLMVVLKYMATPNHWFSHLQHLITTYLRWFWGPPRGGRIPPMFGKKTYIESYRYGKPNEETQGKGFFEMFQWVPNISMLTWWRVRRQKLAMFTVKMSWVRLSDVTVAKSNQTKIWELGRHDIYHPKQGYGQHQHKS